MPIIFNNKILHVQDGYDLRKKILAQLLTVKENECQEKMPNNVYRYI